MGEGSRSGEHGLSRLRWIYRPKCTRTSEALERKSSRVEVINESLKCIAKDIESSTESLEESVEKISRTAMNRRRSMRELIFQMSTVQPNKGKALSPASLGLSSSASPAHIQYDMEDTAHPETNIPRCILGFKIDPGLVLQPVLL